MEWIGSYGDTLARRSVLDLRNLFLSKGVMSKNRLIRTRTLFVGMFGQPLLSSSAVYPSDNWKSKEQA